MAQYTTVAAPGEDAFVEKRSRFIGYCRPVQTEEEALAFIQEIRSKHWDASHNVYAYILREGGIMRYSDDGEPQGTAGVPVLDVLRKPGITDAVIVVTRYFGGILLGGGGLVRAYSHGASIAVKAAGVQVMKECLLLSVRCAYTFYGRLASLVPEHGGIIDDTVYDDAVTISFHMAPEALPAFEKALADATNGSSTVKEEGSRYFAFSPEEI